MDKLTINLVTLLGQARGKAAKAHYVTFILSDCSIDDIMEVIMANSTWQGELGAGCRIMAKVLAQLDD